MAEKRENMSVCKETLYIHPSAHEKSKSLSINSLIVGSCRLVALTNLGPQHSSPNGIGIVDLGSREILLEHLPALQDRELGLVVKDSTYRVIGLQRVTGLLLLQRKKPVWEKLSQDN